MPRPKKDARQLSIKLASEVHDKLDRFSEETGMNKTVAVEKMLTKYLDEYFEKPESERKII